MRLIDIDALYAELQAELGSPEGSTDFLRVNRVLRHAPTIDAIPGEWLRDKFLDLQNKDRALSAAAWLVMHTWEQEQEAKQ